jgi:hypothetical protein
MSKTFIPSISHEGTNINPASGVEQNFSSGKTYTVTAANGDTRAYNVSVSEASRVTASCASVTSSSTVPGTATAYLTLTFNTGVPTLQAENLTLTPSDGGSITKGALTVHDDAEYKVWRLAVSGVSKNNLSVSVGASGSPVGFTLAGFPKTVTVQSDIFQFQSLTASGTPVTNELTLTFDAAVPDLSASNLTLTPEGAATKGALTHSGGGVYKLALSGVSANGVSAQIAVAKSSFSFQPANKSVSLKGPILFTGVTADGEDDTTTTAKITLQFSEDVPGGLSASDITLSPALGKGTLSAKGSGKYELAITSGITASGLAVTVTPAKTDWAFSPASRSVNVYKEAPVYTTTVAATGAAQSWSAPYDGVYKFELWGAQGGNGTVTGAKGGYTYGNIRLNVGETLSLYVGKKGGNRSSGSRGVGGYNGGGNGGAGGGDTPLGAGGGGGATDVRQGGEAVGDRIIVAGGGGGGCGRGSGSDEQKVGVGGGGIPGAASSSGGDGRGASGAKWNAEGTAHTAGNSSGVGGVGASGNGSCYEGDGGGGGGAYGGLADTTTSVATLSGGGGGSSYVDTALFTNAGGANGEDATYGRTGDGQIKITWVDW